MRTAFFFLLTISSGAFAQSDSEAVAREIRDLRGDVRELRASFERGLVIMTRAQITMQRLAIIQSRIDRLSADEEAVRRLLPTASADGARARSKAQALETLIAETPSGPAVWQWNEQLRDVRAEAERALVLEQQLKERLNEILTALRAEESKLVTLDDQLREIETALR